MSVLEMPRRTKPKGTTKREPEDAPEKRGPGRPPTENPKSRTITFKVTERFGAWFDDFAETTLIPKPVLFELALKLLAPILRFTKKAPTDVELPPHAKMEGEK